MPRGLATLIAALVAVPLATCTYGCITYEEFSSIKDHDRGVKVRERALPRQERCVPAKRWTHRLTCPCFVPQNSYTVPNCSDPGVDPLTMQCQQTVRMPAFDEV